MKETIRNIKSVYKYAKDYKINLICEIIGSIISVFINIALPIILAKFISNFTNSLFAQAILMALVIVGIKITSEAKTVLIRKNTQVVHGGMVKNLQVIMSKKILSIKQEDLEKTSSGVFLQRLINDTDNLANMYTTGMGNITGVLSNIGSFIAVLIIDVRVFVYYTITATILTILYLIQNKKYGIKAKEYRKNIDNVTGLSNELIRGTKDIKMLNAKASFISTLNTNIDNKVKSNFAMRNVQIDYNFFIGSIKSIFELGVIILLIYLIQNKSLTISLALALYNYKDNILTNLMEKVSNLLEEAKEFNISYERVFDVINNINYKKEVFGKKHLNIVHGDFSFSNVTFSYDGKKNVLDNISFKVNRNETVAFVGKSGEGKTTIFNLLCKMYDINEGKITIDGNDINELDEESIRGNITIISQNPYIFNLSIKDNLKLVKKNVSDEEIKKACHLACLDDFIESLPNGYDTIVGEGGVLLSGGQRQRLAIARAFVQDTEIILFDEATSALDNETQAKIQKAINNMKKKYTILIIAHRLSTIVDSDRIIVINNGKIEAEGNHNKLLKENKTYKKLYETEISKN